jgi:hypothetical protein
MMRLRIGILFITGALAVTAGIAAAAGLRTSPRDSSPARVAFTQANSLWITTVDGSGKQLIVNGNAKHPLSWYQWSPDGRYLLVVQSDIRTATSDLVLYDVNGVRRRTLVRHLRWSDFYPSWAANADRVAFVAGTCAQGKVAGCAHPTDRAVFSIGVHGRRTFIGSYPSAGGGCGGGLEDPAANLYRVETDFGITMPLLHWRTGRSPSYLGIMGYVPPAAAAARIPPPADIAVSAAGNVAGVTQRCTGTGCTSYVALLDPATGRPLRVVGKGELPAFSPNGATLYFVRRVAEQTLGFHDTNANNVPSTVYRSEIWRVDSAGLHPVKILSQQAYGFGPPTVTPDGGSIIFSRVDNASTLWQHRLPGDRFDASLLASYGPAVRVQRLNLATGAVRTLMQNAGRPAVQ